MVTPLKRLEGRKFCVVFVKVIDAAAERVQLQCLRGRASVDRGKVSVADQHGAMFTLPGTAVANIQPSDGTKLLQDAEYFCLVRVDDSIELVTRQDS
jgi:hypothetical protein